MDASQYKNYVLVLLFMKYVSDKYAGQKDALLVVPKGGSFADMVSAKGDKEIGDKMIVVRRTTFSFQRTGRPVEAVRLHRREPAVFIQIVEHRL